MSAIFCSVLILYFLILWGYQPALKDVSRLKAFIYAISQSAAFQIKQDFNPK